MLPCEDFHLIVATFPSIFYSFTAGRNYPDRCHLYHQLASITILNEGETIHEKVASILRCEHKFSPAALQVNNLSETWKAWRANCAHQYTAFLSAWFESLRSRQACAFSKWPCLKAMDFKFS